MSRIIFCCFSSGDIACDGGCGIGTGDMIGNGSWKMAVGMPLWIAATNWSMWSGFFFFAASGSMSIGDGLSTSDDGCTTSNTSYCCRVIGSSHFTSDTSYCLRNSSSSRP